MLNLLKKFFIFVLILLCTGCGGQKSNQTTLKTITVTSNSSVSSLFFSSTVNPLTNILITSKVDGVIDKMYFKYGVGISKDQLLFVISSAQLESDYQSAIADFIKAKRDYSENQTEMQGTEELNKLGMISRQEYNTDKKQSYDTALAYAQATHKLRQVLAKFGRNLPEQENFNTTDISKLNAILSKAAVTIKIFSPVTGVGFLPEKGGGGDSSSGTLSVDSEVKVGQALVSIGNENGFSFDVKVGENNINQIELGQKAIITGDGFPHTPLHGSVSYFERQPTSNDSGGIPTFLVHIMVPNITEQEKRDIRIGMSARVEIPIMQPAVIKVPINAVFTKNNQSMVKVIDPKTGQAVDMPVTTGATSIDSIEIQQGLKPGDKVQYNDSGN